MRSRIRIPVTFPLRSPLQNRTQVIVNSPVWPITWDVAWGRIFWNSGAFPCIQRRDRRQVWSPDSDRRKLLIFIAAVCLSHRVRLILSFYVDECLPFTAATFDRARHLCTRQVICRALLLWPLILPRCSTYRNGLPATFGLSCYTADTVDLQYIIIKFVCRMQDALFQHVGGPEWHQWRAQCCFLR